LIHFLDSSAMVKRYVRESGTDLVLGLFRRGRSLAGSRLAVVEVAAALARRARRGDIEQRAADAAIARFTADFGRLHVVEVRQRVVERARELVQTVDLRAYDALQLASAIELCKQSGSPLTFVAGDLALLQAAESEGLRPLSV
jgi:predicted nucleic acid-binding protein